MIFLFLPFEMFDRSGITLFWRQRCRVAHLFDDHSYSSNGISASLLVVCKWAVITTGAHFRVMDGFDQSMREILLYPSLIIWRTGLGDWKVGLNVQFARRNKWNELTLYIPLFFPSFLCSLVLMQCCFCFLWFSWRLGCSIASWCKCM